MIIPLEIYPYGMKLQPLKLLASSVETIKLGGNTYEFNKWNPSLSVYVL